MQVVLLAHLHGLVDLICIPIAGSPIEAQPFLNDVVERSANLLNWSFLIVAVRIYHIHVVQLQPFQAALQAFLHVLSAGAPG